mmetsp:Transcript_122864/g.355154  ORF Transcript_122864/g.355154 Transcript_122864/m.355154 type:complete len:300 (+) Transcript_122864:957-1856(+)
MQDEPAAGPQIRYGLHLEEQAVELTGQAGDLVVHDCVDDGAHLRSVVGRGGQAVPDVAAAEAELHEEGVDGGAGRRIRHPRAGDEAVDTRAPPRPLEVASEPQDVQRQQGGRRRRPRDGKIRICPQYVVSAVLEVGGQEVPLIPLGGDQAPVNGLARVERHPERKHDHAARRPPLGVRQHAPEAHRESAAGHRQSVSAEGLPGPFSRARQEPHSARRPVERVALRGTSRDVETVLLGDVEAQGVEDHDPQAVGRRRLEDGVRRERHARDVVELRPAAARGAASGHLRLQCGPRDLRQVQ